MSIITELNAWKNSRKETQNLIGRAYNAELLPVKFMYGETIEGLCGTTFIIDGRSFASINVLRKEIEEQREISRSNNAECDSEENFDEIDPWMLSDREEERLIVCKEGVFEWCWEKEEYVFVREVGRTVRKRVVTILEDAEVFIEMNTVTLRRGETFFLDGEYVAYSNDENPVLMLSIYRSGSAPLAIPFDNRVLNINQQDFAVI